MSAVIEDPGVTLRPMREVDLPTVVDIENAAYQHPWSEGIFRDCLRVGYSCWVTLLDRQIVGHGIMSVAAGECHILNLCVHPDCQRRQIGSKMLRGLLVTASRHNADTAFLEVRGSNRAALGLYEAEGFCEVGIRRGYYPHAKGREDAILMARSL